MRKLLIILFFIPLLGQAQSFFPSFFRGNKTENTVSITSITQWETYCKVSISGKTTGDVVQRGFVYGTLPNPTHSDNSKSTSSVKTDGYAFSVTGLQPN